MIQRWISTKCKSTLCILITRDIQCQKCLFPDAYMGQHGGNRCLSVSLIFLANRDPAGPCFFSPIHILCPRKKDAEGRILLPLQSPWLRQWIKRPYKVTLSCCQEGSFSPKCHYLPTCVQQCAGHGGEEASKHTWRGRRSGKYALEKKGK